uniref:MAP3K12-binding inhibitory protein 1-like n=1 Tax=Phallusia mammillata TaxID=59560 RepID=A0A6F9DL07_9ASCI|nr:MAP3K12-binding inhibitory protein 1-like [Phallusia mammillata]
MGSTNDSHLKNYLKCLKDFGTELGLPPNAFHVSLEYEYPNIDVSLLSTKVENLVSCMQDNLDAFKKEREYKIDESLVQITAPKAQLDKRIASFIAHAQQAVDEQNVREFSITKELTQDDCRCARTHALYQPRPANRTHLEVKRIENTEGPQMQVNSQGNWCAPVVRNIPPASSYSGIQERLQNLENHVGLQTESIPKNVYERIKILENRVLQLESISPEYFTKHAELGTKRQRLSRDDTTQMSIDEIDDRIRLLKQNLLRESGRPV